MSKGKQFFIYLLVVGAIILLLKTCGPESSDTSSSDKDYRTKCYWCGEMFYQPGYGPVLALDGRRPQAPPRSNSGIFCSSKCAWESYHNSR